ncbi:hypothetical protein FOA52_003383 [Chlamydomonas sp. UWO 241]|nr:hypothetical protein FOA52_003383 [Chlamydomonas sp. UWO 241]
MQTRLAASLSAADESAAAIAAATASAHAVLFSLDLCLELWPWLDRGSNAALRGVSSAMRRQVDGLIEMVASPESGFTPGALSSALLRFARTTHLTLFNVGGASDLAPLATTTALARLTSLTVREAPAAVGGVAPEQQQFWPMPALSSGVASTLQVIDISGCARLRSIDFVRNCAQLKCLWMPGCAGVSDLSPLSAYSETLEELWLARNAGIRSLSPLKACPRLRKLDLRGCLPALNAQVQDLRLSCTQLAAPLSVEIVGLVHELQPSIPHDMQEGAADALARMMMQEERLAAQDAIAAAGAIPALVQLLASDSTAEGKAAAADTLGNLTLLHLQNQNSHQPGHRWRCCHSGSGAPAGS